LEVLKKPTEALAKVAGVLDGISIEDMSEYEKMECKQVNTREEVRRMITRNTAKPNCIFLFIGEHPVLQRICSSDY
jgi:hypothetical protein